MNINLSEALGQIDATTAFRLANTARPPGDYLFADLLPEVPREDYQARTADMTVRSTMAGLVGMDSPYPETGVIEVGTFSEGTAKMANRIRLPEADLRQLQQMLLRLQATGGATVEAIQRNALNLLNILVQSHLDTMEYLRGQALATGAIDWTFSQKRLQVTYGVPAANILAERTGTAHYGGTASAFWSDVRALRKLLKYNVRAFIVHPDTLELILGNDANSLEIVAEAQNAFTIQRIVGTTERRSTDARDRVQLISYGLETSKLDLAVDGATTEIPFMPRGRLLAVANNAGTQSVVGEGSDPAPVENALGFTHIAPTVEAGGTPGRWGDVRTPDGQPWSIEARAVTNGLPVLTAPKKVAIARTAMA